jgi:hypothetical protein
MFYYRNTLVAMKKSYGVIKNNNVHRGFSGITVTMNDGFVLFMYDIQQCFICRPSDSTVSEDAEIEARTVATTALTVRRSNHSASLILNVAYRIRLVKRLYFWEQ